MIVPNPGSQENETGIKSLIRFHYAVIKCKFFLKTFSEYAA